MLIKKAYMGEFRHLLSILRMASKDNRCYVAFSKRKFRYTVMLQQLRQLGLIESFEERDELIIVNLKQIYWKSFQTPIRAFDDVVTLSARLRRDRSHKGLAKSQLREGHFMHTTITTDKGIISGFDAISKKTGGLPLFKIY